MTYQNDREMLFFLPFRVLARVKRVLFEKISHFFLKNLAEFLLDLHPAKLGDNLIVYIIFTDDLNVT